MNNELALLPLSSEAFELVSWPDLEPRYRQLTNTALSSETIEAWLAQWSALSEVVDEVAAILEISCTRNTADQEAVVRRQLFLSEVYTPAQAFEQQLTQQLLDSHLTVEGFAIPRRNLQAEVAIYAEANLALLEEEEEITRQYLQTSAEQTVIWEGQPTNASSLKQVLYDPDRQRREKAWRTMTERQLVDQEKVHQLWIEGLKVRQAIANNAGFGNYRDYRWQQLLRFDYTPTDCQSFHQAVAEVVVPAANDIWERRQKKLGIASLRPWDIWVDPRGQLAPPELPPINQLLQQTIAAFGRIDPQLESYFARMVAENLCDLEERPNKANMGYNRHLEARHRPFIFGKVRSLWDIVTVFHEAGHAFQVFEMSRLPYLQQRQAKSLPLEFAEVASTSMELIGAMYLHQAGFCTKQEEIQFRIQHLERFITQLFPLACRGDAFQHWVYENLDLAVNREICNQKWQELSQIFLPQIDWSELERENSLEWQQTRHFFGWPFYYIEYAFAALGAFQVWNNYRAEPQRAIEQYRHALSLGATKTVPELFAAAGGSFTFDTQTLQIAIAGISQAIEDLELQL